MERISPSVEGADRQARWVAMWREAVRTSPLAAGLVELATHRYVEMSPRAAQLLSTTPERGAELSYLSLTERPREATEAFRLVREGVLDGIDGRRRFHGPDGSMVELLVSGWAIRSRSGPDLGLWIALETAPGKSPSNGEEVMTSPPRTQAAAYAEATQVTLDERWRIANISTNAGAVLGRPPAEFLGCSILELVHRDDLAALLLAFARATTEPASDVRIRLHQERGWRTVRVVITMLEGDGTVPFSLIASGAEPPAPDSSAATQLAGHLRRLASQIEAAGVMAPLVVTSAVLGVPSSAELSPRQWEIASRLAQGERVATIAAEMYLSQSTVRNHLSAIFQKFGVHSQQDLLAAWRAGSRGIPPAG